MYGVGYSLVLVGGGGLGKGTRVGVGLGVLEDLGVEEWQL